MNPTLLCSSARESIHERIERLSPERDPVWGTMSAGQMVCHAADHLRVALGDTEVIPGRLAVRLGNREIAVSPGLLRFRPIRYPLVHWLPWPKRRIGAPPEMWKTAPGGWQEDIAALRALVDRFGDRPPFPSWGSHPWFGPVPGREWGSLCWRHLDYHLRQFGV